MALLLSRLFVPSSFSLAGVEANQLRYLPDFISYSFSFLTTTGNYDVAAATSFARMIMMFEIITGTLYIAILISWLVGKLVNPGMNRTVTLIFYPIVLPIDRLEMAAIIIPTAAPSSRILVPALNERA